MDERGQWAARSINSSASEAHFRWAAIGTNTPLHRVHECQACSSWVCAASCSLSRGQCKGDVTVGILWYLSFGMHTGHARHRQSSPCARGEYESVTWRPLQPMRCAPSGAATQVQHPTQAGCCASRRPAACPNCSARIARVADSWRLKSRYSALPAGLLARCSMRPSSSRLNSW